MFVDKSNKLCINLVIRTNKLYKYYTNKFIFITRNIPYEIDNPLAHVAYHSSS